MIDGENEGLWDSFWAVHASSNDLFHRLLWRVRFLFSSAYAHHIANTFGESTGLRMLEVGCGSARTLHYLNHIYANSTCVALDLSPQAMPLNLLNVIQKGAVLILSY